MAAEPRILPMTANLRAAMWRADDNSRAVIINFQAGESEESVAFLVTTSAPILTSFWHMPALRGPHWLSLAESSGVNHYAIAIADHTFLDEAFIVGLEIDTNRDPQDCITGAEVWDRTDATPQIVYIDATSVA